MADWVWLSALPHAPTRPRKNERPRAPQSCTNLWPTLATLARVSPLFSGLPRLRLCNYQPSCPNFSNRPVEITNIHQSNHQCPNSGAKSSDCFCRRYRGVPLFGSFAYHLVVRRPLLFEPPFQQPSHDLTHPTVQSENNSMPLKGLGSSITAHQAHQTHFLPEVLLHLPGKGKSLLAQF